MSYQKPQKKKFYPFSMNDMAMRFNGRKISGSKRPANGGFSFMDSGVRFGGWWNHDAVDKDPYFIIDYAMFQDFCTTIEEFANTPLDKGKLLKTFTPQYYDKKKSEMVEKEDSLIVMRGENGVICLSWKSAKQRYPSIVFEITKLGTYKTMVGVGDDRRELTEAEYSKDRVMGWLENTRWLMSQFNPAAKEEKNDKPTYTPKADAGGASDFEDDFGF